VVETGSSESVEMYLKSVAELGGEHNPVPIGRVAERMSVSTVSANEMMKRLGEGQLIHHLPYKGVTLTKDGRRLANSVIRRQRLWECFLVDHLKLDWAKVHDLACDLEHSTAPEVTEALADYLDHPTRCPHGNPIPNPAGEVLAAIDTPLSDVSIGQTAQIKAIVPAGSDVMAYLVDRGLRPGNRIKVIETAPLQGPLTLRIGEEEAPIETVLGLNLAELVLVEIEE
jgi:DtxR family Mn-dependent transcriptional regulator